MRWLERRKCRCYMGLIVACVVFSVVYFGFFCPGDVCALTSGSPTPKYNGGQLDATVYETKFKHIVPTAFDENALKRDYNFDIEGEEVLVFLHIQKTGGTTFGRQLVTNLQLPIPCICPKKKIFGFAQEKYRKHGRKKKGRKRCECFNSKRRLWLFSRFSTGWACGLHADWTELQGCVEDVLNTQENERRQRRYLYLTILRNPLSRYISEWKHVQRGSTWVTAKLKCNGRSATINEVPLCYTGEDWSGVQLDDFMSCPYNLANDRQSRMLANLSLVHCYDTHSMEQEQRNALILQSAKNNLENMAFFGLTEFQAATQYLFERTFKLKFIDDFIQYNSTHASQVTLTPHQKKRLQAVNQLDSDLYRFAKELFFQRLKHQIEEDLKAGRTELIPPGLVDFIKSADNPANLDPNLLRLKLVDRPTDHHEGDEEEDEYEDDEYEGGEEIKANHHYPTY